MPYNIIPHIDVFQDNLYTKEEMKVTTTDRRKRGKALPVFTSSCYLLPAHLCVALLSLQVTWESRKIMDAPDLKLSCTAVRIPTLRAHSEAITLETEQKISAADVREMLRSAPGVKVVGT